jgi:hypothetical protein
MPSNNFRKIGISMLQHAITSIVTQLKKIYFSQLFPFLIILCVIFGLLYLFPAFQQIFLLLWQKLSTLPMLCALLLTYFGSKCISKVIIFTKKRSPRAKRLLLFVMFFGLTLLLLFIRFYCDSYIHISFECGTNQSGCLFLILFNILLMPLAYLAIHCLIDQLISIKNKIILYICWVIIGCMILCVSLIMLIVFWSSFMLCFS